MGKLLEDSQMKKIELKGTGSGSVQIGEISGGETHFHIYSEKLNSKNNLDSPSEQPAHSNEERNENESSVLLDGWTLAFILSRIENNPTGVDKYAIDCINNFYTALLCWDNVEWVSNSLIHYQSPDRLPDSPVVDELMKVLIPKDLSSYKQDSAVLSSFAKYHFSFSHDDIDVTNTLLGRANEYLQWSAYIKSKYFPHPARAEYLCKARTKVPYTRALLLGVIDKELETYYEESNTEHSDYNVFHCEYPLLYDFIRSQASSVEGQLAVALDLRKDKNVTQLRKSLNEFGKKVIAGNVRAANNAKRELSQLSKEILNSHKTDVRKRGEFEFDITFINRLLNFGAEERTGLYNDNENNRNE
jgi:hypothetical protein